MENPATWTDVEHVINDALEQGFKMNDEVFTGYSLAVQISFALYKAGYLKEGIGEQL